MMIPIPALLDVGSKLLDRFMPDPAKAAEAKAELDAYCNLIRVIHNEIA